MWRAGRLFVDQLMSTLPALYTSTHQCIFYRAASVGMLSGIIIGNIFISMQKLYSIVNVINCTPSVELLKAANQNAPKGSCLVYEVPVTVVQCVVMTTMMMVSVMMVGCIDHDHTDGDANGDYNDDDGGNGDDYNRIKLFQLP